MGKLVMKMMVIRTMIMKLLSRVFKMTTFVTLVMVMPWKIELECRVSPREMPVMTGTMIWIGMMPP